MILIYHSCMYYNTVDEMQFELVYIFSNAPFVPVSNKLVLQDEQLLQGGNLDPRLRIAVGVRAGEKRVLQQIDEILKERELELDELEYYQERRLKDLGLVGEQGDIIFWEPK